jgi:hypothetical protein
MIERLAPVDAFQSWSVMRDVYDVGLNGKLIGYVTEAVIRSSGITKEVHIQKLTGAGLQCIDYGVTSKTHFTDVALFAYHPQKLQKSLRENASLLRKFGWPISARAFCDRVASEFAPERTELFDFVADCFGDAYNPLRKERLISPDGHIQDVIQKPRELPNPYAREDIADCVDKPLVSACEYLFDSGIRVVRAAANARTADRAEPAALWVDYKALSPENKVYADAHSEIKKRGNTQFACFELPMSHRTPSAEIERAMNWYISGFKSQQKAV